MEYILWIGSENNNLFLSCGGNKTIKLWDINSENCLRTFVGHSGTVYDIVRIGGDNNNIFLSCSGNKTIKLWDINIYQYPY